MDFLDSIIDILFVIGAIALGFLPGIKKLLGGEEVKKVVRPVQQEVVEEEEAPRPKRKKNKVAPPQEPQKEEYFSYETMNDRDFENLFTKNNEETFESIAAETPHRDIHLTLDEEEVYKGVVWSEILKRKY